MRKIFKVFSNNRPLAINILTSPVIFVIPYLLLLLRSRNICYELIRNIYYARFISNIEKKLDRPYELIQPASSKASKKIVWIYWNTGVESAPEIVKTCIKRLKKFDDVELRILDDCSLSRFVNFPKAIESKYASGQISTAHYSDLIRLELLYKYGGIWIDSTVLISSERLPEFIKTDKFFVFGMRKPAKNGNPIFLSSWLMTAPVKHPILQVVRSYLHNYWEKNNRLNDYFLFHCVLCATLNRYPELLPSNFGFYDNSRPHILQLKYNDRFCDQEYKEILSLTSVHKLTYKYDQVFKGTYLDKLLTREIT